MELCSYHCVANRTDYHTPSMQETEEQIIERVRNSDKEAFRVLFEKFQPTLFRYVLYRLRDADAAHDLVQDAFVRVWQHRMSLKPDAPFLPYILKIGSNLILDNVKYREVRRRLERDIPAPVASEQDNPEHFLHLTLLEAKVFKIVWTKLAHRCREVFLLSRMEGMSNAEISARLGVSVKTVENHITRALKVLARHLREYTGG